LSDLLSLERVWAVKLNRERIARIRRRPDRDSLHHAGEVISIKVLPASDS